MTDHNRDPQHDPRLQEDSFEERLRAYASTPQPDARFVARLERRLEQKRLGQTTPQPARQSGPLATLAAWWRKSTRPRQKVASVFRVAAALVLFLATAAFFISWLGGIRQMAASPTAPAAAPLSTDRPPSPTPFATGETGVLPISPTPPSASDFPHHQNALLVAPAADGPIPRDEFARLGVDIVPTVDDLRRRLQSELVEVVYVTPGAFPDLTHEDVQQLYDGGQIVVFLDILVSDINARLPIFGAFEGTPAAPYTGAGQFIAVAFQHPVGPTAPDEDWTLSAAYDVQNFWILVHDVERRLQQLAPTHTPPPSTTPPQSLTTTATPARFNGFTPTPTPFDGPIGDPPTPTPFATPAGGPMPGHTPPPPPLP